MKTKYFEKKRQKGKHSNEKKFAFFGSYITEYDKPQKISYTGPRGLLTFIAQLIRYKIVSVRVRYSSEDFFKKSYFFVGKKVWPNFSLFVSSILSTSGNIFQVLPSIHANMCKL